MQYNTLYNKLINEGIGFNAEDLITLDFDNDLITDLINFNKPMYKSSGRSHNYIIFPITQANIHDVQNNRISDLGSAPETDLLMHHILKSTPDKLKGNQTPSLYHTEFLSYDDYAKLLNLAITKFRNEIDVTGFSFVTKVPSHSSLPDDLAEKLAHSYQIPYIPDFIKKATYNDMIADFGHYVDPHLHNTPAQEQLQNIFLNILNGINQPGQYKDKPSEDDYVQARIIKTHFRGRQSQIVNLLKIEPAYQQFLGEIENQFKDIIRQRIHSARDTSHYNSTGSIGKLIKPIRFIVADDNIRLGMTRDIIKKACRDLEGNLQNEIRAYVQQNLNHRFPVFPEIPDNFIEPYFVFLTGYIK